MRDKIFWLKTLSIVILIRVALWILPFKKVRTLVARLASKNTEQWAWVSPGMLHRVAVIITDTSRYVPQATCLTQALATQLILTRWGVPTDLQIGVKRNEVGQLEAHAWVEYKGQVIIGGSEDLQQFAQLPSITGR